MDVLNTDIKCDCAYLYGAPDGPANTVAMDTIKHHINCGFYG